MPQKRAVQQDREAALCRRLGDNVSAARRALGLNMRSARQESWEALWGDGDWEHFPVAILGGACNVVGMLVPG